MQTRLMGLGVATATALLVLALLAGSCAPASESKERQSGSEGQTQTQPEKPKQVEFQQIQQETTRKEQPTPTTQESKGKTSVSGIPLDPNAKTGGILRIVGASAEGPTFSPWEEAAGYAFPAVHPVSNMLVQNQTWGTEEDYKALAFFKLHPDLAKAWEQSADGLKWTFKLRDGVKWSDGQPLTCADVKWSYDTIRSGQGLRRSPRAVHFLALKDIQCPDGLTAVFNMKYPKPAFLEVLGMPYNVIRPKHIYENNTDVMRNEPPKVGTGPFTIKDWIPGEKTTMVRKADYWDQPFPYLDGIESMVLSNQAADSGLRAGRLDISSASGYSGGRAETLLKECAVCRFFPRVTASSTSPKVMLTQTRAPWNDPVVRDAVALAFDNKKYNQVVQLGWYVPPTGCGFYPGTEWEMPKERCAQIPGYGDFFEGGNPEADKQKARELLAQAGYRANDLKVKVRIWVTIQQDTPYIIEELKAVGIDASAEILETARAYDAWTNGDFEIGVHSFWVAGLDPDVLLYEHFYTGSDRNYTRYSNPKFDQLVDQMSRTVDPQARKRMAWDALEMGLRESGGVIVGHSTASPTSNKRVKGWLPALNYLAGYGPMLRWQGVWIDESAK